MVSFINALLVFTLSSFGFLPVKVVEQNDLNKSQKEVRVLKVEELPGSFRQIYKTWDKLDENGKKMLLEKIFIQDKYWGYFFSTWGKYYFYTENTRVLRILKEAIVLTGTEFQQSGVVQTSAEMSHGHWYRETFARNMRLLLDAYAYSREPLVLQLVDHQTKQWIQKNKRVSNSGFKIYPYSAKLNNSRSSEINVNQNLQMGLVFSKLYFQPESKFYLNETIKKIALDEINASLSLFRSDGFIPLNQHAAHVGDSNYAGLSTSILYELVQIWGNEDWNHQLKQSGKWLEKSFHEKRPWNARSDGKDYHFDQFSAYNLFSRIPAFYAAGVSSERAQQWMTFVENQFIDFDVLDLVPRWDHLQTLPESYYANKERQASVKVLAPAIYAELNHQTLNVNIVSTEVTKIKIGDQEMGELDHLMSFKWKISKNDKIQVHDSYQQVGELIIPENWIGKEISVDLKIFDFYRPLKDK